MVASIQWESEDRNLSEVWWCLQAHVSPSAIESNDPLLTCQDRPSLLTAV